MEPPSFNPGPNSPNQIKMQNSNNLKPGSNNNLASQARGSGIQNPPSGGMLRSDTKRMSGGGSSKILGFFDEKQSNIQQSNINDKGFKDVLAKPPLASRSFKKKSTAANGEIEQMRKLKDENREL